MSGLISLSRGNSLRPKGSESIVATRLGSGRVGRVGGVGKEVGKEVGNARGEGEEVLFVVVFLLDKSESHMPPVVVVAAGAGENTNEEDDGGDGEGEAEKEKGLVLLGAMFNEEEEDARNGLIGLLDDVVLPDEKSNKGGGDEEGAGKGAKE